MTNYINRYIYFIKPVGYEGPIKIGCSTSPIRRVMALHVTSPLDLEVVAVAPGTLGTEKWVHDLVWNRKTEARHFALVAASRSNQGLPIDTSWRPLAQKMQAEGVSIGEISKAVGRSAPTVRAWLVKISVTA